MPVEPFKAMSFAKNDVITKDAVEQMQSNLQFIRDNTPRGRFYSTTGEPLDVKTVMVGGKVRIRKTKSMPLGSAKVRFGQAFDPACKPHVTFAIISEEERRIHCVVNGPDGVKYPNSYGFEVYVAIGEGMEVRNKVMREFWVSWHAFGFRSGDVNAF